MKVKELIEILKNVDGEKEVLMSIDPEGNKYDPLYQVDKNCVYSPHYDYQVYDLDWSADDVCMSPEDWHNFKRKAPQCIVLYP